MAKKGKKSLASSFIKSVKKRKRNPEESTSIVSGETMEILETLGAVAGGYVATRSAGRLARNLTAIKWPRFSKHIAVLSSILSLVVIAIATSKWNRLKKYNVAVWGSSIGVLQSLVQTYIPGLSWLLDSSPQAHGHISAPSVPETDDDMVYLPAATSTEEGGDDGIASVGDDEDADLRSGIFAPN